MQTRNHPLLFITLAVVLATLWTLAGGGMPGAYAAPPPIDVFVGYADDLRASPFFPTPWAGDPNVLFIGSGSPFDAGAVRIDNKSGAPLVIDNVTVNLCGGAVSHSPWGGSFTIPTGFSAILTQTTQFNFDTSDECVFQSCGVPAPLGMPPFPEIFITIGGVTTEFDDTAHVLDTGGFDLACIGNESLQWRLIGTCGVDCPGGQTIQVTKDWRFTDVCFKQNPLDCPSGTRPGTLLATDAEGDFLVKAVLKKDGTLSSYNPGQVYAVSTVTVLSDLKGLKITENYTDCTDDTPQILTLNPAVGGGGGSVVVVIDTGDGVLKQILDANSPGVTVTNSQAMVTLTDVAKGTIVRVYVKFGPGAKGQVLGLPTSCENENSAQVLDQAGNPVGSEVKATAVLEVTKP